MHPASRSSEPCIPASIMPGLSPLALLLPFYVFLLLFPVGGSTTHRRCKPAIDSPEWPSPKAWKDLAVSLGGRLLQPTPPGAVCHDDQATHDIDRCAEVTKAWSQYEFHTSNPISAMWNQFANDTCLPDPSYPCSPAGYPVFVINATTPEHVKLGIDFGKQGNPYNIMDWLPILTATLARKHSVRLIVRNTGHDYLGRSAAPNSLSIWTHHMQSIKTHADEFHLRGCDKVIPSNAVTVGPGAQMEDIFAYLAPLNQTVVGGSGRTVGVGGYVTGGGHSPLAPRYGLAADNVLQVEIVTPEGEIVTANEGQHRDLFWAMRGVGYPDNTMSFHRLT